MDTKYLPSLILDGKRSDIVAVVGRGYCHNCGKESFRMVRRINREHKQLCSLCGYNYTYKFHRDDDLPDDKFLSELELNLKRFNGKSPVVSVIILTLNGKEVTKKCLLTLTENIDIPYELILVDNNSINGINDLLKKMPEGVKVIFNPDNYGVGKARNIGIKDSKGEYVYLSDNDILYPKKGFLDPLLNELNAEGKSITGYNLGDITLGGKYRVYVLGCTSLFKRADYDAVGGIDEIFGLCHTEDIDFCWRIAEKTGKPFSILAKTGHTIHIGNMSGDLLKRNGWWHDLLKKNTGIAEERWGKTDAGVESD